MHCLAPPLEITPRRRSRAFSALHSQRFVQRTQCNLVVIREQQQPLPPSSTLTLAPGRSSYSGGVTSVQACRTASCVQQPQGRGVYSNSTALVVGWCGFRMLELLQMAEAGDYMIIYLLKSQLIEARRCRVRA